MIIQLDDIEKCKVKLAGGKAANIAKMRQLGLPTPDGFVSSTDMTFKDRGPDSGFKYGLNANIRYLADKTHKTWGLDYGNPLLVSVRSGAPVSMPGMMDTILNIGLTRENLDRFVQGRGATKAFGLDCYRRLIQMFGTTVKGIEANRFNDIYDAAVIYYGELDEEAYQTLVEIFEDVYMTEVGEEFPQQPTIQLHEAAQAVYGSWFSEKAKTYRELEGISDNLGTAVTVQEMIFGNLDRSATGVVFTHNPNSGTKGLYGDFLKKAQGEDVVAGTHKVRSIHDIFSDHELETSARDLQAAVMRLFHQERDMLDIEFTIERGQLYLLQYRSAKRSNRASVRMLMDMTRDGEISSEEATEKFLAMIPTTQKENSEGNNLAYFGAGLGVTEGKATGVIATSHEAAQQFIDEEKDYIFVSKETSPSDSYYMKYAAGILTAKGGRLSHAAVVARGWNKPCVVSFDKMEVNEDSITINSVQFEDGTLIKIDGSTGEIWL